MKKRFLYGSFIFLLFIVGFIASRNGNGNRAVKRSQILMGTVVEIQVRGADEAGADKAIRAALNEVKRIDLEFSSYNEGSPVWKLNHSKDPVIKVSSEIYAIMLLSDSLWKKSGGAFDVGLESLTEAWGFNRSDPSYPGKEKILNALSSSGWKHIRLLGKNCFVRDANIGLNFGAIAKGYAVDRALEILKKNGIADCLVNAGGEIRTLGSGWVIGIRHPGKENEIIGKIKLNGKAVATSGDYEQFFIKDGKRYSHIMNPATGYPADSCRSVTVIAGSDAEADGLSTAVFVMGPVKGINLIEKLQDAEAMIIDAGGRKILSSGFNKYLLR